MQYLLYNGQLSTYDQSIPLRSLLNRSFYYADAFFDTQLCIKTLGLRNLSLHQQRWTRSAAVLGVELPTELRSAIAYSSLLKDLIVQNEAAVHDFLIVRLQLWRAGHRGYYSDSRQAEWVLELFEHQPRSATLAIERKQGSGNRLALDAQFKSTAAVSYVLAANEMAQNEAILYDSKGHILESISSSILVFEKNCFYAPKTSSEILVGVGRSMWQSIAKHSQIPFIETDIPLDSLYDKQLVFLTNAVEGFRIVSALDGVALHHDPKIGQQLLHLYNAYTQDVCEPIF